MFKKISLGLTMVVFLSMGFSQVLAFNFSFVYPWFCTEQLCCPDTYKDSNWFGTVALGPSTIQCTYWDEFYNTHNIVMSCSTSNCN